MESSISRLDCYEDMFKEITRKLYGEDPDHRTSSVQNEFEASVSYKNDEDTGNGTDGSDDGNWTCEEEPLKGTDGSRIAAYHPGKATWRCYECGDVMGGGPREAAEHFMELHASRILDDTRNRHHSPRKEYMQVDFKIEDVVSYLERLRERAERAAPPSRRTQETQTLPSSLLPMTPNFLDLPSASSSQHLHQNAATMTPSATTSASGKRYTCPYCPYGTDRRDLYTRHENIHREEKPFQCYICYKPFNRADHVKKHFLRMHREHAYEVSKIRRPVGSTAPKQMQQESNATPAAATSVNGQQNQPHTSYQSSFGNNKGYQLQPNTGAISTATGTTSIYQSQTMPTPGILQADASTSRRVQNGGCNSKSHLKGGSKSTQERKYACCYCPWSGVDNWCLKRHLNTHLKPFACTLCEYKAARAERLSTHVLKVHNRRQCSRCPYLADDATQLQMHQLHAHRVSSSNAASTSAAQTAPPPSNRHQQPIHPAGGGRPPPGPPVFPASAPAISPATTVIPPTTILGHEMVMSPATAATMAYPTEEEKRSCRRIGGINGHDDDDGDDHDHDNDVRSNGNREKRSRDLGARRDRRFKNDRDDESYSDRRHGSSEPGATDISNDDFTHSSYQGNYQVQYVRDRSPLRIPTSLSSRTRRVLWAHSRSPSWHHSNLHTSRRKQRQPQRITHVPELGDAHQIPALGSRAEPYPVRNSMCDEKVKVILCARQETSQRLFKCMLCPRYAPARRTSYRAYHTRASLLLHKLWRHKRRHGLSNRPVIRTNSPSPISSITLKAIFFASTTYNYHR